MAGVDYETKKRVYEAINHLIDLGAEEASWFAKMLAADQH